MCASVLYILVPPLTEVLLQMQQKAFEICTGRVFAFYAGLTRNFVV